VFALTAAEVQKLLSEINAVLTSQVWLFDIAAGTVYSMARGAYGNDRRRSRLGLDFIRSQTKKGGCCQIEMVNVFKHDHHLTIKAGPHANTPANNRNADTIEVIVMLHSVDCDR